jgi:hypothetical protein
MTGRRLHRGAIVAGALFVVIGLAFLLDAADIVDLRPAIVLPVALVIAGLALLATAWSGDADAG